MPNFDDDEADRRDRRASHQRRHREPSVHRSSKQLRSLLGQAASLPSSQIYEDGTETRNSKTPVTRGRPTSSVGADVGYECYLDLVSDATPPRASRSSRRQSSYVDGPASKIRRLSGDFSRYSTRRASLSRDAGRGSVGAGQYGYDKPSSSVSHETRDFRPVRSFNEPNPRLRETFSPRAIERMEKHDAMKRRTGENPPEWPSTQEADPSPDFVRICRLSKRTNKAAHHTSAPSDHYLPPHYGWPRLDLDVPRSRSSPPTDIHTLARHLDQQFDARFAGVRMIRAYLKNIQIFFIASWRLSHVEFGDKDRKHYENQQKTFRKNCEGQQRLATTMIGECNLEWSAKEFLREIGCSVDKPFGYYSTRSFELE